MNKAPVLSDEEFDKWCEERCYYKNGICYVANSCNACRYTAQRDADHKHYQGIIREIFEEIERERFAEPQYIPAAGRELVIITLTEDDLQSLKSKYQEEK